MRVCLVFSFFIVQPFLVFDFAVADEAVNLAGFYECNEHFCMGSSDSAADRKLAADVGVAPVELPGVSSQSRNVTIDKRRQTRVNPDPIRRDPLGGGALAQNPGLGGSRNAEPSDEGSVDGEEDLGAEEGSGFAAASSPFQSQPTVGGNIKAGGLFYSGDDSESNTQSNTGSAEIKPLDAGQPDKSLLADSFSPQSAVQANLGQDTSNKRKRRRSGYRGVASAGGGSVAASQSGHVEPAPEAKGFIGSSLDKLVSLMGKFGGASGSGSFSGGGSGPSSAPGGVSQASLKGRRNPRLASIDKRALQENLDAQLRNIASPLQLGSANSNLFESMCNHYENYTRRNRIPNDKQGCQANAFASPGP